MVHRVMCESCLARVDAVDAYVPVAGVTVCGPCWREVPKHLQLEVYRTWRAYQRNPTDQAWDAYIDARDNAIGAIK